MCPQQGSWQLGTRRALQAQGVGPLAPGMSTQPEREFPGSLPPFTLLMWIPPRHRSPVQLLRPTFSCPGSPSSYCICLNHCLFSRQHTDNTRS